MMNQQEFEQKIKEMQQDRQALRDAVNKLQESHKEFEEMLDAHEAKNLALTREEQPHEHIQEN